MKQHYCDVICAHSSNTVVVSSHTTTEQFNQLLWFFNEGRVKGKTKQPESLHQLLRQQLKLLSLSHLRVVMAVITVYTAGNDSRVLYQLWVSADSTEECFNLIETQCDTISSPSVSTGQIQQYLFKTYNKYSSFLRRRVAQVQIFCLCFRTWN